MPLWKPWLCLFDHNSVGMGSCWEVPLKPSLLEGERDPDLQLSPRRASASAPNLSGICWTDWCLSMSFLYCKGPTLDAVPQRDLKSAELRGIISDLSWLSGLDRTLLTQDAAGSCCWPLFNSLPDRALGLIQRPAPCPTSPGGITVRALLLMQWEDWTSWCSCWSLPTPLPVQASLDGCPAIKRIN